MRLAGRHSRRATAALRRLGEGDPAFAALALWCHHRDAEADGRPGGDGAAAASAWTDGRTIHYGPGFEALALHEQVGLVAHQILHVAFRHVPRSRALWGRLGARFDAALFNLATDAIVNETLLLAGHALPRPAVLLSELVRDALGETPTAEEAIGAYDAESLYLRLTAGERPAARGRHDRARPGGAEGDAPTDRARRHARARDFAEDLDARDAAPGGGPEDAAESAAWRQRLARALEAGRLAGRGLGAVGHRLADLPEPAAPWEVVLRGLLAKAVLHAPRPTWRRPTRRWIALDGEARRRGGPTPAFEPGLARTREIARVGVAIDASSSVDDARLGLFAAEIAGLGRRTGAEVHVIVFDDAVRSHTRMQGAAWEREILRVAFARGGGTDFRPAIEAAARLDPSAIVVLTDLEGPVGPPPGRIPVIWAVPGRAPAPPFGRVVSLER